MADPSLLRFRLVVEAALAHLESRREEVNDLNVFPVADGDTGDNMALTLRAVLMELDNLSTQGEIDADESGLDTVWINEGLSSSLDAPANMPQVVTPGRTLEPLATLAFLAAATQRIGLGSGVINVPFRPALPTAKLVATIQELSGGRLRLGVGTGWMEAEFRALGLDPQRKGQMTDDTLAFLHRCFGNDIVEANGQQILFQPRPARPPVYVGGAPPHALRRAVRFGDGWIPAGVEPVDLKPGIARLHEMSAEAGRPPLEVIAMKTLPLEDPPKAVAYARQFLAVGVTHLVHTQGYTSVTEYRHNLEVLEEKIRPALQD